MFRTVAALFVVLFGTAAGLQYNDPDALPWAVMYAVAALSSILCAMGWPQPRWVPWTIVAVTGLWAATLLPAVLGEMALTWNEEERELGGLVIVFGWSIAVARHRD